MSIGSNNGNISGKIARTLAKATETRADAMEKLATGQIFTSRDPRAAERAISEKMDFRLRGMAAAKRNINDAVSMLQTGEASLSEINNMIVRMKELNVAGATTNISDQERRYLFIEYQALHEELNRIALTTEFNGIPLLNGDDERAPEELVFRVDDPIVSEDFDGEDLDIIRFDGFKNVIATTEGLGLNSAIKFLKQSTSNEGISLEDVVSMMEPTEDGFATIYDQALTELSTQRAVFGAMQSRLQRSMDFLDVYQENISAAKSRLTNTDYAQQATRMTEANIMMQASTMLLAQSQFDANLTLNLLTSITR